MARFINDENFLGAAGVVQLAHTRAWIPAIGASWALGVNGLGLAMVLLAAYVTPLVLLASWGEIPAEKLNGKIQRIGINFGAPADRKTESGTLWLGYPHIGGPSPSINIETVPAQPHTYSHHPVRLQGDPPLLVLYLLRYTHHRRHALLLTTSGVKRLRPLITGLQ